MRVIFAGTSDFAVPCIEVLIASPRHELLAVITQPDRPTGRGRELRQSPVKEIAVAHGCPVLQPEKIRAPGSLEQIKAYGPIGALVVVAYGQKIPPDLLNWPERGVVNVHGSILPKYRGAAPIQHALIAGETQTGVTTMLMDEGWDTGDILLQETLDIEPDETAGELSPRLAIIGSRLLIRTLDGLEDGALSPVPQDDDLATLAPSLSAEAGHIDWSRPADTLVNQVRGCTPKPGAFTKRLGKLVKVWRACVCKPDCSVAEPGEVVAIHGGRVEVAAGTGTVDLVDVQTEGRRRVSAADYARGTRLTPGDRFDGFV